MKPARIKRMQFCPIFLSNFNQISTSSIELHESSQYQISRKSVKYESFSYWRTDGRMDELTAWHHINQISHGDLMLPATIKRTYR